MNNPWVFAGADSFLFGQPDSDFTREELILTYADYAQSWLDGSAEGADIKSVSLGKLIKPMLNMFPNEKGGKAY